MPITENQMERLLEILNNASNHIRGVSYGSAEGPIGLEALAMAIAGEGTPGKESLVNTIEDASCAVEEGLKSVASSITRLAKATEMQAEAQAKIAGCLPTLIAALNLKSE